VDATADHISDAFRRLNDFALVQTGADEEELREAVSLLLESVGITPPLLSALSEAIDGALGVPEPDPGQIVYGVIVGLLAGQLERERTP
jgi:hypothetical protein